MASLVKSMWKRHIHYEVSFVKGASNYLRTGNEENLEKGLLKKNLSETI